MHLWVKELLHREREDSLHMLVTGPSRLSCLPGFPGSPVDLAHSRDCSDYTIYNCIIYKMLPTTSKVQKVTL